MTAAEAIQTLREMSEWGMWDAPTRNKYADAVSVLAHELERLGALYSCGYATGQGQNCGKCQQCLTVHEYFLKQGNERLLKQYYEVLTGRDAAVAENKRLRAALEMAAKIDDPAFLRKHLVATLDIARAALAGREQTGQAT